MRSNVNQGMGLPYSIRGMMWHVGVCQVVLTQDNNSEEQEKNNQEIQKQRGRPKKASKLAEEELRMDDMFAQPRGATYGDFQKQQLGLF